MSNNTTAIDIEEIIDLSQVKIDPNWALRIPGNLASRRNVLPFAYVDQKVFVACLDREDRQTMQAVERYLDSPIVPVLAEVDSLASTIKRVFSGPLANTRGNSTPLRSSVASLKNASEPESEDIVGLCDELMHSALIREASDLHIEPGPEWIRVRMRVDGNLEEFRSLPKQVASALTSRVKVLGGMDIAERRAPQDGRFSIKVDQDRDVDIRVATLPTRHGERITLRFLATNTAELTLERLGMSAQNMETFEEAIHKPHGLVLLTGPTGSGKSTTLYAAIRRLIEARSLNVLTIEDPVEYEIEGVSQTEVDSADKVSFQKALRSCLRHDPDVLMIGEIRDQETADVAIKAALTGHLVFSTLHTNSAVNAVTRLIDMGVEPFLVGATLRLTVAQRLVRQLCPACKLPKQLTAEQARVLEAEDLSGARVYENGGCIRCGGRGFQGRKGVFEMVSVDAELAHAISIGSPESELLKIVRDSGTARLIDDAKEKMLRGNASVLETMRAVTVF